MESIIENWEKKSLGDIVTLKYGKGLPERQREPAPYPVYGSGGLVDFHSEWLVKGPGIIVGRKGSIGTVYFEKNNFFPIDTVYFVEPRYQDMEFRFIYYLLSQMKLSSLNSDSAVPGLNRDVAHSQQCLIPPLPIQRKIAAILSAYDDLIENNTRRIKILEQMAQILYREWFVHFRFPGHERVKMVDSPVGKVQKGWEVNLLRDICERVNYGYTASAQEEPVGPKFLRITDIVPYLIDWDSVTYCNIEEKDLPKSELKEADIFVARTGSTTGTAKRLHRRHPQTVFASYLVRLRVSAEYSNYYLSLIIESDVYKRFIKANLGGAAQPQANAQALTSFPMVVPPIDSQKTFDRIVEVIFVEREVLQIKNTTLRRTRDMLLPKMASGEAEVERVQID